jgi:hypothetical protein
MSTIGISDVLSRMPQSADRIQQPKNGSMPDSMLGISSGSSSSSSAAGSPSSPAFSSRVTQDQSSAPMATAASVTDPGLNPSVVSSWLVVEDSSGWAHARQVVGNNDWLNIGYTGSGTYGAGDSVWSSPVAAANATAQWLQGQQWISGDGTSSSGIHAIRQSVGQSPATQIKAIQEARCTSSGCPSSLRSAVTSSLDRGCG